MVINCGPKEVDTKMSYRYKDSQSQPSSLPRRYFSLPKNYSSQNSTNSKDSLLSSRYRSTSSSASTSTTPSAQSSRYGSSRTYGTSTSTSSADDFKIPTSRRLGTSSISSRSAGSSAVPRKNSYPLSLSSNLTPSYTTRYLTSIPCRGSGSSSVSGRNDSSWAPGDVPVRQRSSITLRDTKTVWGPDGPPVRQHSSSSLHDSPFTVPSRRTYSSTQGSSDTETQSITSRRKTSPALRSISPPTTARHGNYSESQIDKTTSRRKASPVETKTEPSSNSPTATVHHGNGGESEMSKSLSYGKTSPVETKPVLSSGETDKIQTRRKTRPVEATSARPVSPTNVQYQGSQSKEEKPASPKSPIVQYFGSVPQKESPGSRSEASTTSSSRRGSSGSQGGSSGNGDELESSAARDISLLSREIASAYEGSLSRSDSRKGKNLLKKPQSVDKSKEKMADEKVNVDKGVVDEKKTKRNGKTSQGKRPGTFHKGHKRSSSTGSPAPKAETKKPGRKLSGVFSRKKLSRESTDSEAEDDKSQRKSLFPNKGSKDSVKDSHSSARRGSSSSAHSVSPPPRRKISGPGRFFSSSDSKTTPEAPKKFSVPGKFFTSKDSKSGGESSDLDSETGRSRPSMRRRVSLPGILGFPRSSSAERAATLPRSPEPSVDPALLKRRRSNFKKAQSVDVQSDSSKNSKLGKLKFWDHTKKNKSPDSLMSASPNEGRSPSMSPVESSVGKHSEHSTEKKLENNVAQSRQSRERTLEMKSSLERGKTEAVKRRGAGLTGEKKLTDSSEVVHTGEKKLTDSSEVVHTAKEDDTVRKNGKEAKVLYVGPVEKSSPSAQRARKRAQYKINLENKSTITPAENLTDVKTSEASVTQVKENSNDGTTRDTVSKLRERRRKRREERERFFAGVDQASKEEHKKQEAVQKDQVPPEPESVNESKKKAVDVDGDKTDGKIISENTTQKERNDKRGEPTPKLSAIGKRPTVDNILQKGSKLRSGKLRYQTIASSVHADIIADLIREKGLNSTTSNEVKIPSVAELRAKFLISKDDGKVSPPRVILKLDDRPNSICGEVLSPTEMRKFDDITFSLAKKVSSDDIKVKNFSDSSSDSLPKLDTQWKTIPKKSETSPPSSPKVKSSSKKEKKEEKASKEESNVTEEQDVTVEGDILKKRRGSKKKRKISLFGHDKDKDKEAKTPEEDADLPHHGAVSAAIKAMFTRKPSTTEKAKPSRKHRTKSAPDSSENSEIIKATTDRERKKSAPEEIARKSPDTVDAHPVKAERKESKGHGKTEKTEEVKDVERKRSEKDKKLQPKEKDIELQPISEIEQKPKERKSLKKRK